MTSWMLNGQFEAQGNTYWRIDDIDLMEQEHHAGTYDPIAWMTSFSMAVNVKSVPTADAMHDLLAKLNGPR